MYKRIQYLGLELRPCLAVLYRLQSQIDNWTSLVWDFFPIFLGWLLQKMSSIEKRAFVLRLAAAASAVNVVYWLGSYAFYFGRLPGWVSYPIADLVIDPFRSVFTFSPIGWTVTIGAEVSGPTMTTTLVAVRSLEQYIIALIVVSCVFAILTDLSLWRRFRLYVKCLLGRNARGRQLRLDGFMSRCFRAKFAPFFFGRNSRLLNIRSI